MLSPILQISLIEQLPLAQAGQLLLVVVISFAVITLVSSTYRFHRMIMVGEDALKTVEDLNYFFFIQVSRYLSKINRVSSGFGVLIVQFSTEEPDKQKVQKELLAVLRSTIRHVSDKACLFRDDCVAAIIDTEEEHVPLVAQHMMIDLKKAVTTVPGVKAFRAGVSSFPLHGLDTQILVDSAVQALETADFGSSLPVCIAPAPDVAQEKENEPEVVGELGKESRNTALDPLTGVLRPEVIGSYIRKYLAEIRMKKGQAALLCVGINRIDQIIKLHGEESADDVIAGVSKILQKLTRDCDLIGRYHRDDFLILARCTLQQGEMIATRLREAVQKEVFISGGKPIKTAISIGITAHPEHGRTLGDLFSGAYRALEVIRGWNTAACLVYDPSQHAEKAKHETRRKH
jgi:diguanylate cyclase (GGDEF)-like protein